MLSRQKTHTKEWKWKEDDMDKASKTLGGESEYIKSGRPVKRLCQRAAGYEIDFTEAQDTRPTFISQLQAPA